MKENEQKNQTKSWGIIIAVLSVCIIATAFFDYLNITISGKNEILDKIMDLAGVTGDYVKISPRQMLTNMASIRDLLEEIGISSSGILGKMGIFFIIPYIFAVVAAVLGFFDSLYTGIAAIISAVLGMAGLLVDYYVILPRSIAEIAAAYKVSGIFKLVLNVDIEETIRKTITSSFCAAYWICVALFAGIAVISVLKLIFGQKKEDVQEQQLPVLRCMCGDLKNMEIEMGESEILVGRDTRRCALIISEQGVDQVHCMIRFNRESNNYGVVDISNTMTCIFINNDVDGNTVPLQKGIMCTVERGSWIGVGDRDNLLQLL